MSSLPRVYWNQSLSSGTHSSHEWIHDPGRPFEMAITTSTFSSSSSTASSCSLFERLLWRHGLCILDLHILQLFLKVIFWCMFFPSNSLVNESNIFGVFREDTCGTSWSVTESTMIFLALTKFFLCKASNLISLWNWNLYTHVGVQYIFFREIKYFYAWNLSTSPSLSSS